jgi:hypothetical protein
MCCQRAENFHYVRRLLDAGVDDVLGGLFDQLPPEQLDQLLATIDREVENLVALVDERILHPLPQQFDQIRLPPL